MFALNYYVQIIFGYYFADNVGVYKMAASETRAVPVFATERKNNVDPRPRALKKVNYVTSDVVTSDVSNIYE